MVPFQVTAHPPAGAPAAPKGRSSRVLVVEDDPLFRRFSMAALHGARRARLEVDTAGSWEEARGLLQASAYDCLVLDLGLPDSQGLDTVRAALAAAPTVPVVVLTGEEDDGIAERALAVGVQDFLEKAQADPSTLERAILHAVDRARWTAELAAKNRELRLRNQELDDFAHAISHDLKAPLRAIYHLVAEAEERLAAADTAAAREGLAGIAPRVKRLFGMIDGVLHLTQAGRGPGEPEAVDSGAVVAEVVDSLAVPTGFRVGVAAAMPALVARRTALAQVFQNLVDNALKHHHRAAGTVEVGWRDAGAAVEFTVADDGPGIPAALRERAFRLFQSFGKPEGGGTGIGLALARKLVEANGGRIWIEEGPGGGACFRFTWPKGPPGGG